MKKNKQTKKGLIAHKIVGFLFTLCSLILLGIVLLANVLPLKYLAILIGIILFLNIIINFFLRKKRVKK